MSKRVKIGNLYIGGGERVAVQSMTTFRVSDTENTLKQLRALTRAGCDIARFAVLDEADAKSIKKIKEKINVPLVADIHFDYRLAIASIENGADKVRINPGNIGSESNIIKVADCIKAHGVAVRVGANTGSIEKSVLEKYGKTARALAESAMNNVSVLEKHGVSDIVISVKASSVSLTVGAYREIKKMTDYPLHIGVTEAGLKYDGIIKNSIGIGVLLLDGIGDTLRVSLSDNPVEEVKAGKAILRAVGLDKNYAEVIACPTCGRCAWNCMAFARKVKKYVQNIKVPIKIAVMGCAVNGPGEAKDCDVGVAGGKDGCIIFKKGQTLCRVSESELFEKFIQEIDLCAAEKATK